MTYSNPNHAYKQANTEEIKDQIRAFLTTELSVDPDAVYLNGVNNLEERMVISSASLTEEAWQRVYENDAPEYFGPTAGLFRVAYSFADEDRLSTPDLAHLSKAIGQLVSDLG